MLLIAISAVGPMALNGVLPATSVVVEELATRYEVAQMVLTVFLFASLLSQLVMGPAADRYGRRPVMLVNLSIFIVGSVVCATAQSIEVLLLGRFVQGVGVAVCVFLPRTIVRDIYSQDRAASVIGYLTTAMMIAPLFGPAVGGWITDNYSWRFIYAGLAILGCGLLLATLRYQSETLVKTISSPSMQVPSGSGNFLLASAVLFKEPRFVACTLMQAGAVGAYYTFLAGAPYVAMESRGLSASTYGIWFAVVAIGYLGGNLVAGRFSVRLGVHRMVLYGFVPLAVGICLFWLLLFTHHPAGLFLPMLIVAFSNGMSLPSMVTIAMSIRPELAASASGLSGSAQTAFGVVLTVIAGYALPFADVWLHILISCSAGLSILGLWLTTNSRVVNATA